MEYTPRELREMSDEEAKQTLTVAQYERREKLLDLLEQADENQERLAEQDQQVQEITVDADMEQLGTEVDLFGNDVLVHIDSGNRQFRQAANALESVDEFDDESEVVDLDDETRETIANRLQDMLDAVLVRWDGTRWSEISEPKRGAVLDQCRTEWGVDGLMLAWFKIGEAVTEERQEVEELIDSFRSA